MPKKSPPAKPQGGGKQTDVPESKGSWDKQKEFGRKAASDDHLWRGSSATD